MSGIDFKNLKMSEYIFALSVDYFCNCLEMEMNYFEDVQGKF